MKDFNHGVYRPENLRSEAEKRLKKGEAKPPLPPPAETELLKLVHELQVHQVELEMQKDELQQAHKELQETLRRYFELFYFAPSGYFLLEADGTILEVNPAGTEMLGMNRQILLRKNFYLFVDFNQRDIFYKFIRSVQETVQKQSCKLDLLKIGKPVIHALLEAVALRDRTEKGKKMQLAVTDITQLKEAEDSLKQNELFLKDILDSIQDGISINDMDYNILMLNSTMERMFIKNAPLAGKKCYEAYHNRNTVCEKCPGVRTLDTKTPAYEISPYTTPQGTNGFRELYSFPFFDFRTKQLNGFIEYFRDVTLKKELDTEKEKAQRLEAIGLLAGGLAHDFNNLLQTILTSLAIVKMKVEKGEDISQLLSQTEEICLNAGEITKRLLIFSYGGEPLKENFRLEELTKNTAQKIVMNRGIHCNFFFSSSLHELYGEKALIQQVIRNIVLNAKEAMPEGGIINIYAANIRIRKVNGMPLDDGNYVKITIEDNGKGIPQEDLPKIFDPYYSTKERGAEKGMGLGLSVCHSIVKKHKGLIKVESKPGKGSRFHIYLPAAT